MSKTLDWAEGHLGLAKSGNLDYNLVMEIIVVIEELKRAEKKVQELEAILLKIKKKVDSPRLSPEGTLRHIDRELKKAQQGGSDE